MCVGRPRKMGASTAVRVPLLFLLTCCLLRCVATKAMSVLSIECVVEEVIVAGGGKAASAMDDKA